MTQATSVLIEEPDSLIMMNQPSLVKFESWLKKDGLLVANESLIDKKPERKDITSVMICASELADKELGSNKVANLVTLGAYLKTTKMFSQEDTLPGF